MDSPSMHRDPVMTDIALVQVHLPSGASTIQGIVRHPDGGPIVAGSLLRKRPVATGGSEVVFPPTAPLRDAERCDPSRWTLTEATDVEAELQARGWAVITRHDALTLLRAQGYRLRSSEQPGHAIYTDQDDNATWYPGGHPSEPDPYTRLAFAVRAIVVPDDLRCLPPTPA